MLTLCGVGGSMVRAMIFAGTELPSVLAPGPFVDICTRQALRVDLHGDVG